MTEPGRLDLARPRTLGPLLTDALRLYFSNFLTFVAIGAAVVIPVELIVGGVGLKQFTSGFDDTPELAGVLVPFVTRALVTTPLVTAMATYALLDLANGDRPRAGRTIQSGLDAFRPVFVPVIVAIAVEAVATLALVLPLALAVGSALVPTLLIPLALAVYWYFVPEVVVVAGTRGLAALRASWETTRGSGLRVAGILIIAYALIGTAGGVVATPVLAAAKSADSGALVVLGGIVSETLAAPAIALLSALLYFDLRTRRAEAPGR